MKCYRLVVIVITLKYRKTRNVEDGHGASLANRKQCKNRNPNDCYISQARNFLGH